MQFSSISEEMFQYSCGYTILSLLIHFWKVDILIHFWKVNKSQYPPPFKWSTLNTKNLFHRKNFKYQNNLYIWQWFLTKVELKRNLRTSRMNLRFMQINAKLTVKYNLKQYFFDLQSPTPPQYVFWYHNEQMINYDTARGGISVETVPGPRTQSRLTIRDTNDADSGNYTCSASNTEPASIYVFVSEGKFIFTISFRVVEQETQWIEMARSLPLGYFETVFEIIWSAESCFFLCCFLLLTYKYELVNLLWRESVSWYSIKTYRIRRDLLLIQKVRNKSMSFIKYCFVIRIFRLKAAS